MATREQVGPPSSGPSPAVVRSPQASVRGEGRTAQQPPGGGNEFPLSRWRERGLGGEGGPGDPFDGFFAGPPRPAAAANGLLDIPGAHAWMSLVEWGSHTDLYTFQVPLDGRSGPRVEARGQPMLMLSSYDYLGLIGHPAIEAAAVEAVRTYGTGTGGVRLLTGTNSLHRELEHDLAIFKGTESAITFTSGYTAALAVISALFGPRDRVILDARSHRSVIDACKLAGVPFRRFRHNDPESLEAELRRELPARRTLVIVEGVYSMDGDICPLPEIVEVKRRHGAYLMVDEAHSFGVLGRTGRGIDEHWGVEPTEVDIWMGSLSKAIPANGGFLAGRRELMIYLQHGAAPYMFSAALCPAAAGAARAALQVIAAEPERLARMRRNALRLREGLRRLGFDTGASATPIVPVVQGANEAAFRLARDLFSLGIIATAVIPPAVPRHAARLRLCATAAHTPADIAEALAAFRAVRAPAAVGGSVTAALNGCSSPPLPLAGEGAGG
ncbi:N/A [soil metagenome]|nr:pyridoxal phosphate-dependent aminotransferase family protein [Gemmatimonadota bacterium]